MKGGGVALKSLSLFLRIIEFCCAVVILALFSYFLANLHSNNRHIPQYERAVEGIGGAAVLYTLIAFLFVCCLGGIAFFSFIAIVLDALFTGAFIYVAIASKHGAKSGSGTISTPLGTGAAHSKVTDSAITYKTAHHLESAVLAVAIIGAVFFFLNMFVEFGLMRHHKKEKAFGPSPNNGYTAGSPKRHFWQKKNRDTEMGAYGTKVHPDALPPHTAPSDVRDSYATDTTAVADQVPQSKYGNTAPVSGAGGYTTPAAGNTGGYTSGNTAGYTPAAAGTHQTGSVLPIPGHHYTPGDQVLPGNGKTAEMPVGNYGSSGQAY